MDNYLTQLSNGLALPKGLRTKGNEIMQKVFKLLEQKSRYPLARLRPLGGLEKATSIWYKVDYDCVVYVNGESPPFKEVLSEFQDILLMNFNLTEADIKMSRWSLQFAIDGVDFDLLTATNMVPPNDRSRDTVMTQHRLMLQKIKRSRNLRQAADDNSAGLCEAAVEFVKRQSTFVHEVARFAKLWNTTVFYPKYLSGRSSIMETLAIKAGQEEEQNNGHNKSILRAFRLFLVKVQNIRTCNLGFYEFYDPSDVPDYIKQQRPLLLDPSSPYNNLLHGLSDDAARVFAKCASETLRRFQKVEVQATYGAPPDLVSLFEPQPPVKEFILDLGFKIPKEWLSSTETCNGDAQPHLYIRRMDGLMPKFLECIKLVFASMAEMVHYNFVFSPKKGSKGDAKAAQRKLEEFIDTSIRGVTHSAWSPCDDSHESYDVTFEIPVGPASKKCVSISAKWGRL